jgi:hypothetical protein
MSSPEASWNTRLAVHYTDDRGVDHEISPIQSFTPTFAATAGWSCSGWSRSCR